MGSWLLGHPDGTRDALIEAALGDDERSALAAWDRLLSTGISIRRDAVVARWLPLVFHNVGASITPSRSQQILKQADQQAWAHAVRLIAAAAPVITALGEGGVQSVLLKGAALAAAVYPHPGVRPFGDVDLLVRPEQFSLAQSTLIDLGWKPTSTPGGRLGDVAHAINFAGPSGGVIDLHRFLLPDTPWPEADRALWDRREAVTFGGVDAWVPSPADQLLHLCVHGLRWSPVHAATWLADVAWTIRRSGDRMQWDVLVNEARRRRLSYQVGEAVRLVGQVARVQVPEAMLIALRAQVAVGERLECRLRIHPPRGASGLLMYWFAWRRTAREDGSRQLGFVRYLAGQAGLTSARGFGGWAARHVERRWFGRGPTRSDGRSNAPTLRR